MTVQVGMRMGVYRRKYFAVQMTSENLMQRASDYLVRSMGVR
jgi:hypothetical protein